MTAALVAEPVAAPVPRVGLDELGALTPVGRAGGQGRVYRPQRQPAGEPVVVKLYRRAPSASTMAVLAEMIAFGGELPTRRHERLHELTAWPLAIVEGADRAGAGIVMRDLTPRFSVPFIMPSGRRTGVLLSLEHLLGDDDYLLARGLDVPLGTVMRLRVAQRISSALAFLHELGVVVGDIAPNNLLVRFGHAGAPVGFIDCDSMVLRGRQALPAVQTADWQLPGDEPAGTREADAYKLGLVVLRLLTRSHDARTLDAGRRHVPLMLREPLARALGRDPSVRPTPQEWQRALGAASVTPGIGRLHPGPPSRRVARPASAAPAPRGQSAARSPFAAPRTGPRPSQAGGLSALTLVWLAIAAILVTMLLVRLFAAAIPTSSAPQFSGGADRGGPVFVVPSDRGGGRFNPGT